MFKKREMLILLLLFVASSFIGCASSYFSSTIEPVGQYSGSNFNSNTENPRLFLQTTVEGVNVLPDRIEVDTLKYDVIGRIDVYREDGAWFTKFTKYNEEWRRTYCPVSSILTMGTAFVLFFTGIPCMYEHFDSKSSFEERRNNAIAEMIRKGKEVGATHIVYARFLDNTKLHTETSGGFGLLPISGMMVGSMNSKSDAEIETFKYSGMVGLAIRAK
jgi:hypothetical protein